MQTQYATTTRNYFDREGIEQYAHRCDAWFYFYPDRISMLIADKQTMKILGLSILEIDNVFDKGLSELRDLCGRFEFFEKEYQQTHIVFVNRSYTFVPEPLFDATDAAEYLKLVHSLPKLHSAYHERAGNKVNVYAIKDIFYNTVRVLLPGAVFHHYATLLTDALAHLHEKQNKDRLYINIHTQYMDVLYYVGHQLHYHNIFQTEADTDIIYFTLSVAELLKLNTEKWEVVLCGEVNSNNSLISLMKKYIPNVLLATRPETLDYPASFREFQEQQYYTEISAAING